MQPLKAARYALSHPTQNQQQQQMPAADPVSIGARWGARNQGQQASNDER
jgi:hypothetical protein